MNRKLTVVFAALLVVAGIVYLMMGSEPLPLTPETARLFEGRPDDLTRIESARKGEAETVLERTQDSAGASWKVTRPADRAADPDVVQAMVLGFARFSKANALEPGRPESDPALTGMREPRLTVSFHAGGRRETLRFGGEPKTQQGCVFFQREGDPRIYAADRGDFERYDKPYKEIRSRKLARFEAFRAVKIVMESRFVVVRRGEMPAVEYEESTFERDPGKGWVLTKPWSEKLDDMTVNILTAGLADLEALEFLAPEEVKGSHLDRYETRVSVFLHKVDKPVVFRFGAPAGKAGEKRYAQVEDTGEVALVEQKKLDGLPLERKKCRSNVLYLFTKEQVKTLSVEAPSLGRLRIERRETRTRKGEEDLVAVSWEVAEPADVRLDKTRVEPFVDNVLAQKVTDFFGRQPDLKLYRLDPPDVSLAVETKDGLRHVFHLGLNPETVDGYLRKEGVDEVFSVRGEFVKLLKRMELNFRDAEMFSVPREKLTGFRFEARDRTRLEPVYYAVALDAKEKKWRFSDPVHQGDEIDADRVDSLLTTMNYIRAEGFVSRETAAADEFLLDRRRPPARLTILTAEGGTDLYISEDLGLSAGAPVYYARFEGNPIVFKIAGMFVETLRRVPVLQSGSGR